MNGMNGGMRSPVNGRFGGNQYPPNPNQPRRNDYDEAQLSNQMAGMDISQRPGMPMSRNSDGSQRSMVRPPDGGLPPPGPPLGFEEGRRGSEPAPNPYQGPPGGPGPVDPNQGYADPGYGPGPRGPPGNEYGPPSRSMTLPVNDPMQPRQNQMGPPQRMGPMPYGPGPNRGMPPPPRPATSQGQRPPPQRIYPNQGPPPQAGYGAGPGYGNGPQHPARQGSRASYDDIFDSYGDYGPPPPNSSNDMPNFDAIPRHGPQSSMDLHMRPGGLPNGPGPGPQQPGLNLPRTKSQPNLRNGQDTIFEMPGDAPPVPALPPGQFGGAPGQPMPMRRPSASGLPPGPASMRGGPPAGLPPNPSPPQQANPDALPSHPTPVRPGLMADSVVSVTNRPPPVRTYGGASPAPMMSNSGPPSSAPPSELPPDPVTTEELERLRVIVKADPNDQETALRFAKRLVEASEVLIPNVADPKTRARSRDRYLADAHKVLKKLASAQNRDAMFFLADCLGRSLFGNEADNKEAFTLYQSAAKLGHAAAAYRTAVCCEIGHEDGGGTRKDPLKAIQWYKRAATLGDTPAMYKMGMIQLKGLLGQPKNPREAIGWLKRAADQATVENPHALHELGLLYESAQPNDVIIRDEKYAFSLFKKAAELGYKFSQFRLGCAYEYGLMGCPIDPRLSIMWYSKAAMQEEHQSELALSGWYLTGSDGVLAQSDTEAYLWARKAAMAGLAKAEYAMGYFTEDGIGVPANMEDAKRWYWRAAGMFPQPSHIKTKDLYANDYGLLNNSPRFPQGQRAP